VTARVGDDWRPTASREALRARGRLLGHLRAFFAERGVLEVETPALSAACTTAPYLESFITGGDPGLYLHTSPELPMKRLLAAGSGSIYQIARVFRAGERGPLHNPEFTLLEWYRTGFDHLDLMAEVEELVCGVLGRGPAVRLTYAQAFQRHAGLDPHLAPLSVIRGAAATLTGGGVQGLGADDRDAWLDLLMGLVVAPGLAAEGLVFVYDYPASQAALARVRPGVPPVAERFELLVDGVEVANGFHELADAAEQRARFEAERAARRVHGMVDVPLDERLLAALAHGLPDCAGVALGVDRLLMCQLGAESLDRVVAFPIERA
jgi:lysyl-tRNA synthetase class 2